MNDSNNTSRIIKNTLLLNTSTLTSRGIGFVISILLARYLGAIGFGRYTFAVQFTGLFTILMDLGLDFTTVREVARDRTTASKYLGQSLIIRLYSLFVAVCLIAITVHIMKYTSVVKIAIYLMGIYALFKVYGKSFNAIFMAFECMQYVALTEILLMITSVIGISWCIYFKCSFLRLLLVFPAAICLYLIISLVLIIKQSVIPDFRPDISFSLKFIKESFPFVLVGIFLTVLTRVDTVMIKTMKGDIATGYYGIGRTLISALIFIPANFNAVFYPLYSRLYISNKALLHKYYEKSFHFMLILALPIGVGGALLADNIVVLIYGSQYQPAVLSFQILIWALVLQFLYSNVNILLIASNKQNIVARITFLSMLLNIVLNFFLISRFSYIGASIATLLTNCLLLTGFFILASREIHRPKVFYVLLKTSICVLTMGVIIYLFRSYNVILVIISAAFLYAGLLCGFQVITKEDIVLFRQIRKKK